MIFFAAFMQYLNEIMKQNKNESIEPFLVKFPGSVASFTLLETFGTIEDFLKELNLLVKMCDQNQLDLNLQTVQAKRLIVQPLISIISYAGYFSVSEKIDLSLFHRLLKLSDAPFIYAYLGAEALFLNKDLLSQLTVHSQTKTALINLVSDFAPADWLKFSMANLKFIPCVIFAVKIRS